MHKLTLQPVPFGSGSNSRRIQISRLESCLGLCASESAEPRATAAASARTAAHTLHMVSRCRQRGAVSWTQEMTKQWDMQHIQHQNIGRDLCDLDLSRGCRRLSSTHTLSHWTHRLLIPSFKKHWTVTETDFLKITKPYFLLPTLREKSALSGDPLGDMLGISGQYVTLEGSRLILLMFPLKKAHLMSGTCVIPGETFTISVPESLPAPASPLPSFGHYSWATASFSGFFRPTRE